MGEIEITKTRYETVPKEKINNIASSNEVVNDPDELLYWSSSGPQLTQEQINELAVNSPLAVKPKRAKKDKV